MGATDQPLKNRTIMITRAAAQSKQIVRLIEELGGTAVLFPMIEITEPRSWEGCDRAIVKLKKYDGIIFTSANAVHGFLSRLRKMFPQAMDVVRRRCVYAVGTQTKKVLAEYGIENVHTPAEFTGDALVGMMTASGIAGKAFLLPAGNLTRDVVERGLTDAEAVVDTVQVYRTEKPAEIDRDRLAELFRKRVVDIVTFFSPSGVRHFFDTVDVGIVANVPVAVIGKVTYDAVKEYGIEPAVMPVDATGESMVDAIVMYFKSV
jgi:uroporphyrinogen-III synthase